MDTEEGRGNDATKSDAIDKNSGYFLQQKQQCFRENTEKEDWFRTSESITTVSSLQAKYVNKLQSFSKVLFPQHFNVEKVGGDSSTRESSN